MTSNRFYRKDGKTFYDQLGERIGKRLTPQNHPRFHREKENTRSTINQQDTDPIQAYASSGYESNLVFVGMSFTGQGRDEVFQAIKESCKTVRLVACRVDDNVGSGFIILDIIALIEKAEFIIFDLTNEKPNVYYELGYAHGVGNSSESILLIAKKGEQLHFDIAGLKVHFYESTEELKTLIINNMKEMIKASR